MQSRYSLNTQVCNNRFTTFFAKLIVINFTKGMLNAHVYNNQILRTRGCCEHIFFGFTEKSYEDT